MIDTYRCDDKDQLVAFLYDEIDPASRRRVEDHLRVCPTCAAEAGELQGTRQALAEWQPPDVVLGVTIPETERVGASDGAARPFVDERGSPAESPADVLRPARWWRPLAVPAWAQAAAAVLVVGAGLALANIQVRYDANGLMVTTGWMAPASPAASPAGGVAAATVARPSTSEDWRPALAALERQLRGEIQSTRAIEPTRVSLPPREAGGVSLERVSSLIAESERRQNRELALRLTQLGRDIEVQRRTDNRRNVQAIGQIEGLTGAEMLRQRQALDYIMRVSTQPPPQ